MDVSIAHDYLLQHGGAERVVSTWAEQLPDSAVSCLAYRPEKTFSVFQAREVRVALKGVRAANRIEYLLPLLPTFARRVVVDEGDVALVSTSGWAHMFNYSIPTVAYVHSPARWLYAADDYKRNLGLTGKLGLTASRAYLTFRDRRAMSTMSAVVSNSETTRQRVKDAYGIESEVIHPPVTPVSLFEEAPSRSLPSVFGIVVSRDKGYKNVALAIAALRLAGFSAVVVGSGSERHSSDDAGVFGLGRVSDSQLKWLYRHAAVIVGSAHEDFGLTILEANLEGTPSAALPRGGYRETVSPNVSGVLAKDDSPEALSRAISRAIDLDRGEVAAWGERFTPEGHMRKLQEVIDGVI